MDGFSIQFMNDIYKKLLDEVNIGIHAIDEKGKTIVYNKKMMEIESMERAEVLDKALLDVFTFHNEGQSTLVEALNNGKVTKNIKQTYFNNKGKEITTINDTFPIKKNGKIITAVEIAKDVTQLEQMIKENVLQKRGANFTFEQIIGNSVQIQSVIEEAKRATRTSSSVLLIGETGTGKELFAQSIHNGSNRSGKPFIAQNCAAIPDSLIESLLFGTKKGAFTGAIDKLGLFEQANGGTLLLDEINSLEPTLQAKLLRVIQEKSICRVGGTKDIDVDVRIIATINEDPIVSMESGRLREDLYYRLSVISLYVPPLRERKEDITPLTQIFIDKFNHLFQMNVRSFTNEANVILHQHDWPGNVRELEHIVEGMMNLLIDDEFLDVIHIPYRFRKKYDQYIAQNPSSTTFDTHPRTLQEKMAETEKLYIQQILCENSYNITHTAKILGISRQSLQYRLRKYGL